MLDKELQFFQKNRSQLLTKFKGKFLVIKDEQIVGAYESEAEAYSQSAQKYELGSFLIQQCLPENQLSPQIFHSRVVLS